MRILVISDLYPPHFLGGYELNCELQAVELADRGHEVFVLTSRWGVGKGTVEGNVYRLLHVDPSGLGLPNEAVLPDPLRLSRRWNQLKWAFACRRNYRIAKQTVATLNPNLAYIWHMAGVSITPILAVQDRGIPTVFNIGDYWLANLKRVLDLEPNWLKRRYRAALLGLGRVDELDLQHLLVISRWLVQCHVGLGFAPEALSVIPPGISSDLVRDAEGLGNPAQTEAGKVRLVFAGRLVPEKGPDVAIRAMVHLVEEMALVNSSLDVVGTGPDGYVRELKNLAITLGLEERVHFMGRLEHSQVLDCYAEYDALLFTSRWAEPFGMVIIEAMARGLPVVATECGDVPNIITDGENGLLVPPDEPALVAEAIKKLVQCPALAEKIRHAALKTVRQNYTHERTADQTEQYLQMVVRGTHLSSSLAG